MKRTAFLSPDALKAFKALAAKERASLRDAMKEQLEESDATEETNNRFKLRRPSEHADYELRVDPLRVFYRVEKDRVRVTLIGRKRGSALIINGRRFVL